MYINYTSVQIFKVRFVSLVSKSAKISFIIDCIKILVIQTFDLTGMVMSAILNGVSKSALKYIKHLWVELKLRLDMDMLNSYSGKTNKFIGQQLSLACDLIPTFVFKCFAKTCKATVLQFVTLPRYKLTRFHYMFISVRIC